MSFIRLDPQDFVVSADSVVSPAWSGNINTLTTFYTSSSQASGITGNFYLDVYKDNPQLTSSADVQFSIAYANKFGLGATPYNSSITGSTPTSTLYGQMRNLLLEDENTDFNFGGIISDDFYIININRSHYKEKLMPGAWNLKLGILSEDDGLQLTDNSNDVLIPTYYGTQPIYYGTQKVYQIVNGYNGHGTSNQNTTITSTGYTLNSGSYGLFFPDTSILLLNARALDLSYANGGISLNTTSSYTAAHNERKLLPFLNDMNNGKYFQLSSEETITSNYVFIRARNSELNYSENPSFISGSTGEVVHDSFIYNPQTYITTVGLYNDNNELLAVSKLSKPLKKDFSSEALIRIKLDF